MKVAELSDEGKQRMDHLVYANFQVIPACVGGLLFMAVTSQGGAFNIPFQTDYNFLTAFGVRPTDKAAIAVFNFVCCAQVAMVMGLVLYFVNRHELRRYGLKEFHGWALYFSAASLALILVAAFLGCFEFYSKGW